MGKKFDAKWQQENAWQRKAQVMQYFWHLILHKIGAGKVQDSEPWDEHEDEEHSLLPQPHQWYLRWIALCDADTAKMFETFINTTCDDTSDYTVPIRTRFRSYTGRWIMPLSWRRMLIDQERLCTLCLIRRKRDVPSRFGYVFANIPDDE